jgi:NADPH:quinone reductase-like Zn-dependent oxidoreductase
MQSIHITEYTSPDGYKLGELPAPAIEDPRDVLVKVHAASVNPIDVKVANGAMKSIVSQA